MESTKSARASRSPNDPKDGPAEKDGSWEIEMQPSTSARLAVEEPISQARAGQDLLEQTFHYLRGFLERRYP
jgi:hypothetical protein